ncbi:Rv3235 family protein [Modestobacter sp. Leaf380]|uniref:Rv3235 family protein n=1 Tax=Modestobacter sp. Leaf380 TaxID=1736356 RepID=UPI000B1F83F2|nr:Rv3235 family protein [Modestobacter sp. Leaf380]
MSAPLPLPPTDGPHTPARAAAPVAPAPADTTPDATPDCWGTSASDRPSRATRPHGVHLRLVRTPGPPLDTRPVTRLTLPGVPSPRPAPVPGPRPALDLPEPEEFGPVASRRSDLPDPAVAGRRLVTTTLEAFTGRRSFTQLHSAFTLPVFAAVSRGRRPRWCTEGTGPLLVSSVRVTEPVDGVAEVTAVARRNGRAHAVAARMEGIDGRWRCTALQVG